MGDITAGRREAETESEEGIPMKIRRFDPNDFHPAHEGTILARGVFGSEEIGAPFGCALGLLKPGMAQKPERVPLAKIYYVRHGEGILQIEEETETLRTGDVVFIPPNALHSVRNEGEEDFGTFAVWWTPEEKA